VLPSVHKTQAGVPSRMYIPCLGWAANACTSRTKARRPESRADGVGRIHIRSRWAREGGVIGKAFRGLSSNFDDQPTVIGRVEKGAIPE